MTARTPAEAQQRVVCAALRNGHGFIVTGARHFDAGMQKILACLGRNEGVWEQGFIDQYGAFLTRREARMVAFAANQIIRRVGGDTEELYSENLY